MGGAFNIYELLPDFLVSSAAIIVVSLLTEAPSEEIIREFESIQNPSVVKNTAARSDETYAI
jgi:sodium/proline symporter